MMQMEKKAKGKVWAIYSRRGILLALYLTEKEARFHNPKFYLKGRKLVQVVVERLTP